MKSCPPLRVFLTILTLAATLVAFNACQNTGSGGSAPAAGTGPGSHPNKNTDTGAGAGIR